MVNTNRPSDDHCLSRLTEVRILGIDRIVRVVAPGGYWGRERWPHGKKDEEDDQSSIEAARTGCRLLFAIEMLDADRPLSLCIMGMQNEADVRLNMRLGSA